MLLAIALLLMVATEGLAQNAIRVYKNDKTHTTFLKSEVKQIKFDADKAMQSITTKTDTTYKFDMNEVDSVRSFNITFLVNVIFSDSPYGRWYDYGWEKQGHRPYFDLRRDGTLVFYNGESYLKGTWTMDDSNICFYLNDALLYKIKLKMITKDFLCGEVSINDGRGNMMPWGIQSLLREIKGDWTIDYDQLAGKKWGVYAIDLDDEALVNSNGKLYQVFDGKGNVKSYVGDCLFAQGTYTIDKAKKLLTTHLKYLIGEDAGESDTAHYQICNLTDRSLILYEIVTDEDDDPDGSDGFMELRIIE